MQQQIFKPELDIPEKAFQLFVACNSASKHWSFKQSFYRFKSELLQAKGKFNGFDLQIIERGCWSCVKGIWGTNEICFKCGGTGIYSTNKVALKRYLLNGNIFHEPVGRVNSSGQLEGFGRYINPVNTIKGIIEHAEPEINPTYAYLILLYKYDKEQFLATVAAIGKAQQGKAKNKWNRTLRKAKNMLIGICDYLEIKDRKTEQELDDLPF